jgi:hypothetical protein
MLGSAVSSRTPRDFQPNPHNGLAADPVISRYAEAAPPGNAYVAVGTQRALHSAIDLPKRSTSESWMLALVMPPEVRKNLRGAALLAVGAWRFARGDQPRRTAQRSPQPSRANPAAIPRVHSHGILENVVAIVVLGTSSRAPLHAARSSQRARRFDRAHDHRGHRGHDQSCVQRRRRSDDISELAQARLVRPDVSPQSRASSHRPPRTQREPHAASPLRLSGEGRRDWLDNRRRE